MTAIDQNIIQQCKRGNEKAFSQVYRHCYSYLLGTVKRYIKDHEEAVFQMNTGFATAMCQIKKYNGSGSFSAWIKRVVVNSTIDHIRKQKVYVSHLERYGEQVNTTLNYNGNLNAGEQTLAYNELLDLLDILPPVTKEAFNLFVIDGYKHDEISEMLSISVGTSKWHISNARKKLMDALKKRNEAENEAINTKSKTVLR